MAKKDKNKKDKSKKDKSKKNKKVELIDITEIDRKKQMAEMLLFSDKMKPETEQKFLTVIGEVICKKGPKRITWSFNEKSIRKTTLMAMLRGKKEESKDKEKEKSKKKKDKENKKQAENELLLTQKQLDKKYKTSLLNDYLESNQFGKKKFRKAITKATEDKKKMKGQDILDLMNEKFGDIIPTHDFFRIFESMDRSK